MPSRASRNTKPQPATTCSAPARPAPTTTPSKKRTRNASEQRGGDRPTRRLSALDAACQVLTSLQAKEASTGLTTSELIERMRRARLWSSPAGKTPQATLYSAIIREIGDRKSESRFKRVAPGRFAASTAAKRAPKSALRAPKPATNGPGAEPRPTKVPGRPARKPAPAARP